MSSFTSRTRLAGTVALAAALVLGASACSITVESKGGGNPTTAGGSAPQTAAGTPSASATSARTQSSSGSAQAPAGGPTVDQMTPAGTSLALGKPASILVTNGKPDKDYYDRQLFEVKVTSIEKGSYADLASLDKDGKYKGYTPFYIHSEVTLKDAVKPVKYVSWNDTGFRSLLAGGARADSLIIFGGFDKCPSASSFKALGDTRQACSVALAPAGTAVAQVTYTGYSSNYPTSDLNPYTDKPIVWGN
ncbi:MULTISPECIES: hypothetical protein [Arthrobacter]|uniref:DUF3455 domain-containing protein n=2 Tax=Arthrobacter TaxID=1663 RepID=A0ABU9KMA6_9MICC|nr:hypothetical protein [Arthrobacter sp. YJM1]MDP5227827.1 hypothetical protein [Arthrobacter sp. YJM1]